MGSLRLITFEVELNHVVASRLTTGETYAKEKKTNCRHNGEEQHRGLSALQEVP